MAVGNMGRISHLSRIGPIHCDALMHSIHRIKLCIQRSSNPQVPAFRNEWEGGTSEKLGHLHNL